MKQVHKDQVKGCLDWGGFGQEKTANPYFIVTSLIIVGGLLQEGSTDSLSCSDETKLIDIARELMKQGIQFAHDPVVTVCNLEYGDDFLRDSPQADCLLFAWVNKDIENPGDISIGGESPLLKQGHTWQQAISRSNSPLITMITDNWTCVGTDDVPQNYRQINNCSDALSQRSFVYKKDQTSSIQP